MNTFHGYSLEKGEYVEKRLTRSFKTLAEAEKFARNKDVVDIYRSKGKFTVEWKKTTYIYWE